MTMRDRVRRGESEPRPTVLGGEVRVEHLGQRLGIDTWARVLDLDRDELPFGIAPRDLVDVAPTDRDRPTVGHGLPRVQQQVVQHLVDLPRVDTDEAEIVGKVDTGLASRSA